MFSHNEEKKVEDFQDREDLRRSPVNELVEIVFQINFYSCFFLSLQRKRNLIPVLRALYVFTDEQLSCLKAHLKESKVEDLQDRIDLSNKPVNILVKIVFEKPFDQFEEDFFEYKWRKRNLIPILQALFIFTDAQLTCLQERVAVENEKYLNPPNRVRP